MKKNCNDTQFELLCNYGTILASKSIVVRNDVRDEHQFSLYKVLEPFPTFDEFAEGEEFEEGELLTNCSSLEEVQIAQLEYKLQQATAPVLV